MREPTSLADERGVATVLACFAILALLATAILVVQFTAVVAARHRAQAAADLAALAAAGALTSGSAEACAAAADLAAEMGTHVQDCVVDGWDTTVTVGVRTWLGGLGLRDVRAVARAGPVAPDVVIGGHPRNGGGASPDPLAGQSGHAKT